MNNSDLIRRGVAFEAIYALHVDGKEGIMNAPRSSYGEDLRDVLATIGDIPAVPQEMSAKEFFPAMARMCEYYNEIECKGCPLNHKKYEDLCTFLCFNHDDSEVADIVLAWAREHFERSEE